MKDSDDIANLLKQFGGRPDEYYEIGRASEAKDSQARWPLLSSIEATQGEHHPPVEPHTPANSIQPNLRARVAPLASGPASEARADATRTETRVEPRFAPPAPAAEPPATAAPARSAPQAQFVPPRPRGHIIPPTRPAGAPAGGLPGGFSSMREALPEMLPPAPEPLRQTVRAAPAPVAPASTPLARSSTAPAHAEITPLQAIFQRLSQPQPTPDPATARDKSASLLQRLSRL